MTDLTTPQYGDCHQRNYDLPDLQQILPQPDKRVFHYDSVTSESKHPAYEDIA